MSSVEILERKLGNQAAVKGRLLSVRVALSEKVNAVVDRTEGIVRQRATIEADSVRLLYYSRGT